jgi:hypothetical protein
MLTEQLMQGLIEQDQKPVDNIKANLTEGEYVIPADIVLILGNGNAEEGSRALDQMVLELRNNTKKDIVSGG